MKKKLISLFIILALSMSLIGCTAQTATPPQTQPQSADIKSTTPKPTPKPVPKQAPIVKTIPKPIPKAPIVKQERKDITVYITRTGAKYHLDGCRYLRKSKISINLSDAKDEGYTPCSVCGAPY